MHGQVLDGTGNASLDFLWQDTNTTVTTQRAVCYICPDLLRSSSLRALLLRVGLCIDFVSFETSADDADFVDTGDRSRYLTSGRFGVNAGKRGSRVRNRWR